MHRLLKDGAKLVTCVKEIVEDYKHIININEIQLAFKPESAIMLSADEVEIVRMMSDEPVSIDTILEETQFTFGHLHAVLLSLLLKKAIKQLPGSTYIRA
ncbi:hypothetical protein D3C84_949750 [compost metagenome]